MKLKGFSGKRNENDLRIRTEMRIRTLHARGDDPFVSDCFPIKLFYFVPKFSSIFN